MKPKSRLRLNGRQKLICLACLLAFPILGCGIIGFVENPAPLTGPNYWTAETATPISTVTIFLGTTTPVYPPTPVPGQITAVPEWTTVTATPIFPPPTVTPFGFTATPYWVTTTPVYITETPIPPWTTTPGLPQIGYTTPVPSETPYYRIGTFYMNSDVYIGGPGGLVFRVIDHQVQPSPNSETAVYHYLTIRVTNYTAEEIIIPVSDVFFIRQVNGQGGAVVRGRWVPQNEPILAAGLPDYETQQLDPIPPDGQRDIILGFVLPEGEVKEAGLITHWERPVEGGLPVWFYLENDPLGPFIDADQPPPPTPILLDDAGVPGGGGQPGGGDGMWPTTGTVTRGFGCDEYYTGIDGAGYGCPPDKPWFHNGVDIANVTGTAVWSPVDGSVIYAGSNPTGPDCSNIPGSQPPYNGLGNYQKVQGLDANGTDTLHYFGHLSAFVQTAGSVTAGQITAEMGSSGCSTGPHLHWMLYQNGNLVDPAVWAGPGPNP
jgi:murein DD-endopeptidase MepM/ murein hydrolase activator NlpD